MADILKRKERQAVGKIREILKTLYHAPEILNVLQTRLGHAEERIGSAEERLGSDEKRLDDTEVWVSGAKSRLDDTELWASGAKSRLDDTEIWVNSAKRRMDSAEGALAELKSRMDGLTAERIADLLCADRETLSRMNREMSVEKTIWGDPGRIHLAPTAAVNACLFNTNSGSITIGEYTFAGNRVSLLAGSHDPRLTGFLRRDAEITGGCDIEIGKGVWLASGCTVLGPCRIGDNAVIAAGAVLTPGTEVEAGTIWGGVPAKQIGRVSTEEEEHSPAVIRAMERSGGILYYTGWSEKQMAPGRPLPGHRMEGKRAEVVTDRQAIRMQYRLEGGGKDAELTLRGGGGETRVTLSGMEGEITATVPRAGTGPEKILMEKETDEPVWIRMEAAGEGR